MTRRTWRKRRYWSGWQSKLGIAMHNYLEISSSFFSGVSLHESMLVVAWLLQQDIASQDHSPEHSYRHRSSRYNAITYVSNMSFSSYFETKWRHLWLLLQRISIIQHLLYATLVYAYQFTVLAYFEDHQHGCSNTLCMQEQSGSWSKFLPTTIRRLACWSSWQHGMCGLQAEVSSLVVQLGVWISWEILVIDIQWFKMDDSTVQQYRIPLHDDFHSCQDVRQTE